MKRFRHHRTENDLITAQEIACWAYCPEQWRLPPAPPVSMAASFVPASLVWNARRLHRRSECHVTQSFGDGSCEAPGSLFGRSPCGRRASFPQNENGKPTCAAVDDRGESACRTQGRGRLDSAPCTHCSSSSRRTRDCPRQCGRDACGRRCDRTRTAHVSRLEAGDNIHIARPSVAVPDVLMRRPCSRFVYGCLLRDKRALACIRSTK
jgi:hypothetical protein